MAEKTMAPVLILGGTGVVGSRIAQILRQSYPDLPLALAGRNQDKADALAKKIGKAQVVKVDLERADLGLAPGASYSAVMGILKDHTLNSLKYAQLKGLPYLSIPDIAIEIGMSAALYAHKPTRSAVALSSHWLAGFALMPTLHFARQFRSLRTIKIVAVVDPEDESGPMVAVDFEHIAAANPHPLLLDEGKWSWAGDEIANRRVKNMEGTEFDARALSVLDVLSLAAATDARSIRFDLGVNQSASRRRGEAPSHEVIVEMEGEQKDGKSGRLRLDIVAPQGASQMTALCTVLNLERLLGLANGPAVAPGLYFPELLNDPAYVVQRLKESGVQIRSS